MRSIIFIQSVLITICFYFVLQLFFGSYGLGAIRDQDKYLEILVAHIEALQDTQEQLKEDLVALQIDSQRIEEEARRIGYYAPSDVVIRRVPHEPVESGNDFGSYLYSPTDIRGDSRALFRWLAIIFGLLYLIVFSLIDTARNTRSKD